MTFRYKVAVIRFLFLCYGNIDQASEGKNSNEINIFSKTFILKYV